jgi:4-oxalocrotonate tautomerase
MPVVRVTFYEGRSAEKKREVAETITEALVRVCGSKREAVHVIFENIAKDDWVIGGASEYGNAAKSAKPAETARPANTAKPAKTAKPK